VAGWPVILAGCLAGGGRVRSGHARALHGGWHGRRGRWAATARKITAASPAGLDWGHSSFICLRNYMY